MRKMVRYYLDDDPFEEVITGRLEAWEVWKEPKTGDAWRVAFTLAEIDGGLECVKMTIEPCSDDGVVALRPLTASTVDALPFRSVLDQARRKSAQARRGAVSEEALQAMERWRHEQKRDLPPELADVLFRGDRPPTQSMVGMAEHEAALLDPPRPEPRTGGRHAPYTREDLERVAEIYRRAIRSRVLAPTRAVEEELPCSRSQAGKLVWRCRQEGLLPPTKPGISGWEEGE